MKRLCKFLYSVELSILYRTRAVCEFAPQMKDVAGTYTDRKKDIERAAGSMGLV